MVSVTALGLAAVKGTRWTTVELVEIGAGGVAGDREFLVVDGDRLLLTTRNPRLAQVVSVWDGSELELRFPSGQVVRSLPEAGEPLVTKNYEGREVPGRAVEGPLAAGLSRHLGRPVRLLRRDAGALGPDDAPVTVVSSATVAAVGVADARRWRMNVVLEGAEAWDEHGWGGREVVVGGARLRVDAPVPRCAVTTRDPETGERDAPTLKRLAELRGKRDVTLGVWCSVVAPGAVSVGDLVTPAPAA